MTAAIGLFVNLGLTLPSASSLSPTRKGEIVLVNGASSSVGTFVVQLAKRAGYSIIGIAGRSGGIAAALGADKIVDYRGKDGEAVAIAVKEAVEGLGGRIVGTYDAISEGESGKTLGAALQPAGGKITTLLPNIQSGYENVTIIQTNVSQRPAIVLSRIVPDSVDYCMVNSGWHFPLGERRVRCQVV